MTLYHITWQIDLEAETLVEAARKALEMIQEEETTATVFEVRAPRGRGVFTIDLNEVICDNCAWHGDSSEGIVPIPNLEQRIDPNGQVPACECPACGALAYSRD